MIALTHILSPRIGDCELSFVDRQPIDLQKAEAQHRAYCDILRDCGLELIELTVNREFPDGTFIEDIAVVVDELAVMTRPGAASRRGEVPGIEAVLRKYRTIRRIEAPGTLDGGDVLQMEKSIFVGLTRRTDEAGIESLRQLLAPFDYHVAAVKVMGSLHLKSACTALDDETLLMNPRWIDPVAFSDYRLVHVHEDEPHAANCLRIGDIVLMPAGFPRTMGRLISLGYQVKALDISELQKAEAGLTCSSLIFRND